MEPPVLGQTDILKYRTQHNTAEKVQEADSQDETSPAINRTSIRATRHGLEVPRQGEHY